MMFMAGGYSYKQGLSQGFSNKQGISGGIQKTGYITRVFKQGKKCRLFTELLRKKTIKYAVFKQASSIEAWLISNTLRPGILDYTHTPLTWNCTRTREVLN